MSFRRYLHPRTPALIAGLALVAVHTAASPVTLAAQTPTSPTAGEQTPTAGGADAPAPDALWRDGKWKAGLSMGSPLVEWRPDPLFFTIGVHAQQFPKGRLGFEASLGTAALAVVTGAPVVGGRGGVTMPLRTDSLLFLPSAGLSFVASAQSSAPAAASGFYTGLATVNPQGLRLGLTMHWLRGAGSSAWLNRPILLLELGGLRL